MAEGWYTNNASPFEGNAFGVRKIVDCKVAEGGRQMYKVEWEPTWEPADSLTSCQHLVDKFWSLVNNAKSKEHIALQLQRKVAKKTRISTESPSARSDDLPRMYDNVKCEVDELITRTHGTSIQSPSQMLAKLSPHIRKPKANDPISIIDVDMDDPPVKSEPLKSRTSNPQQSTTTIKTSSPASSVPSDALRYIENFSNPYVRLVVVCTICSKEQSLKSSYKWRMHYLTHEKVHQHKCPHCEKTFIRKDKMRNHINAKHVKMEKSKKEEDEDEDWY